MSSTKKVSKNLSEDKCAPHIDSGGARLAGRGNMGLLSCATASDLQSAKKISLLGILGVFCKLFLVPMLCVSLQVAQPGSSMKLSILLLLFFFRAGFVNKTFRFTSLS